MIRPEVMNMLHERRTDSLIDLLYTTPTRVAEWFKKQNVAITLDDCEKLMLNH